MALSIALGIILAALLWPVVTWLIGFILGIFLEILGEIVKAIEVASKPFRSNKEPAKGPSDPSNVADVVAWVIILGLIAMMVYYFLIKSGMWYVLLTGKPVS